MKPFNQGQEAFKRGDAPNPYHTYKDFEKYRSWELGFNKAYFANLRKIEKDGTRKRH